MTSPSSPRARALADELLSIASSGSPSANDAATASATDALASAARVGRHLAAELSRWFGPYGYNALLVRALASARFEHVALENVRVGALPTSELEDLAAAATAHGIGPTIDGVEAVLAALIDLLGRLIGEDLAVTFIDHAARAMTRDTTRTARGSAKSDSADTAGTTRGEDVP